MAETLQEGKFALFLLSTNVPCSENLSALSYCPKLSWALLWNCNETRRFKRRVQSQSFGPKFITCFPSFRMLRGGSSVPIAMPLRMLEVFTEGRLYSQSDDISETAVDHAVCDTLLYLVQKGWCTPYALTSQTDRRPRSEEKESHSLDHCMHATRTITQRRSRCMPSTHTWTNESYDAGRGRPSICDIIWIRSIEVSVLPN